MSEHKDFLNLLKKAHNQEIANTPEEKEGFIDPVLRCDSCNKLVFKKTISHLGLCNHCGNKRFRPVDVISEDELIQIKKLDGAEDFLKLFKEAESLNNGIEDNILKSKPFFGKHNRGC